MLHIVEMVTAGSDNLAITTNWLIAMLCHQPEVQARVHQELDLFVSTHGRLPELKERAAVPYVFAAIREAMRWRAATFFGLNHSVIEDCNVHMIPYLGEREKLITSLSQWLWMAISSPKTPLSMLI